MRNIRCASNSPKRGKILSALAVDVSQTERRRASGTLLLDVTGAGPVRHSVPAPEVSGPYHCEPYDMSVTGRDIRVVDGAYTDDPDAPVGPPVVDAWVRFRDVPDDPCLHAGLLAQFTGHMSIAAAMRPHHGVGQQQAHRTLSTAINAISLSLHCEPRADHWMLYHHVSTFAGDGMTRSECRVHDEEGLLLASFSVDAMVRDFERRLRHSTTGAHCELDDGKRTSQRQPGRAVQPRGAAGTHLRGALSPPGAGRAAGCDRAGQ